MFEDFRHFRLSVTVYAIVISGWYALESRVWKKWWNLKENRVGPLRLSHGVRLSRGAREVIGIGGSKCSSSVVTGSSRGLL